MHNVRQILSLTLVAAISSCSYLHIERNLSAGAGDWGMYGGDIQRANIAHADIPPPLTQLWEYNAGAGFSSYSASIAESTLIIGTLHGEIQIVDALTGKGLGSHAFGSAVVGTPIIDHDMLYVALSHSEESLVAFDIQRGKADWQAKLGDIESAPLLVNNRIVVAAVRGKVVCVDPQESGRSIT